MKKYYIGALVVTAAFLVSVFLASCQKTSNLSFAGDKILLYAKPSGGINLYHFDTKQTETLTNQRDFYPHLFTDKKTIYFIRVNTKEVKKTIANNNNSFDQSIEQNLSKTEKRWAEIYSIDPLSRKERKVSTILLYDPGVDPKDMVKFVDDFKKIIVFSQFLPTRIFDVASGKMVTGSPSSYFPQCNTLSNNQTFFAHVRQIPKKDFLVSLEQLEIPNYFDRLFEVSIDGKMELIQESGKEEILKKFFYGYTFSTTENKLIFSYHRNLFIRGDNKNNDLLFPGLHPFCLGNQAGKQEHLQFPWFQCSFLLEDKEKVIIAEKNRLMILNKKEKQPTMITKDSLTIINDNPDPTYLFDNIEWISFIKNNSSILLISSKKIDENTGPDRIVDLGKSPDLILLLNWRNNQISKQFEMFGKKDFTFDLKDLNGDGKNEIINQYSASDFLCEERFQAAGRSLVWIDVFVKDSNDIYGIANQNFPQIYQELLTRLKPFHQRAITAKRLKEPILCEDDLKKLEILIREAEIITRTQ